MNKIIRSRAPLRISFAGGGTDVPPYPELYGGAVINTTIDRYAYVTLKKNSKKGLRVLSQDYGLLEQFDSASKLKISGKTSLIKAAIIQSGLQKENLDIIIHADSQPGSGLGSSSAVSVALMGCIGRYKNKNYNSYQIAELAIKLERELVGIEGGFQDQYASVFGGFNFMEFTKSVTVNPLRIRPEILHELLASIILLDTGKTRVSGNIIKKQIKQSQEKNKSVLKNLDFIKKLAFDMKEYLLKGDIVSIGKVLDSNWSHKKTLDKGITNVTIEKIYHAAKRGGAFGGKLLGAGGGGHMLFICDPDERLQIIGKIKKLGVNVVKFNFDQEGLKTWVLENNKVII